VADASGSRAKEKPEKNHDFVQQGLWNPFGKGKAIIFWEAFI
jgi:hypothetical protein